MKMNIHVLCLLVCLAISGDLFAKNQGGKNSRQNRSDQQNSVVKNLTELEVHHLLYMREEEKMARDVYLTFYSKFGNKIFLNIANSEQVHTDKIGDLLEKYGISDPTTDDTIGVYSDQIFIDLFNQLINTGLESELDALMVGGLIEEIDIFDIQHSIADTSHLDIINVYENLMKGSRNHFRSFASVIESLTDQPYTAQFLSQEEVESIIYSDMEIGK